MGKNNLRSFKRFIVVDADSGKPMAFSVDQFCYCTTSYWEDTHFPVKSYSWNQAHKLIEKSHKYRKRKGFQRNEFELMPISSR